MASNSRAYTSNCKENLELLLLLTNKYSADTDKQRRYRSDDIAEAVVAEFECK